MTYRQLLKALTELPQNNLDDTATICIRTGGDAEYYGVNSSAHSENDDVLDKGHFFMIVGTLGT
jgi:hypothetical protein